MTISSTLLTTFAPLHNVDPTGIRIHQAPDLFALWGALEKNAKEVLPPPFWGTVWPGARVASTYLFKNSHFVAGKTVLDIGCGCGIVAIAAVLAGARRAVANDIDPDALTVATFNAAANSVAIEIDARDLLHEPAAEDVDVVVASDMFYEASVADPFFTLLSRYAAAGALVIVADGNRPFTPREHLSLIATDTVSVDRAIEGRDSRTVSLYQLT